MKRSCSKHLNSNIKSRRGRLIRHTIRQIINDLGCSEYCDMKGYEISPRTADYNKNMNAEKIECEYHDEIVFLKVYRALSKLMSI